MSPATSPSASPGVCSVRSSATCLSRPSSAAAPPTRSPTPPSAWYAPCAQGIRGHRTYPRPPAQARCPDEGWRAPVLRWGRPPPRATATSRAVVFRARCAGPGYPRGYPRARTGCAPARRRRMGSRSTCRPRARLMLRSRSVVVCICTANRSPTTDRSFPHRPGSGKCRSPKADVIVKACARACSEHLHRPDCRPGRPLCRYRRKAPTGRNQMCDCEAYHHRHRWGSGHCAGGYPDPVKMEAFLHRTVRRAR